MKRPNVFRVALVLALGGSALAIAVLLGPKLWWLP